MHQAQNLFTYLAIGSFLLLIFRTACCFNIDTDFPIVYEDPTKKTDTTFSSYFGYTAVISPESKANKDPWIKIGAPRGHDPKLTKFSRPGLVYHCPYMKTCSPVDIFNGSYNEGDILNSSWIGGTMDISYEFEKLVICGFRKSVEGGTEDYYSFGICFISNLTGPYRKIKNLIDTYSISVKNGKEKKVTIYLYGHAQYGFSAHFNSDNTDTDLILGAPGVYNWAGDVIGIKEKSLEVFTPDVMRSPVFDIYDLCGYAITSGKFYGNKKLYYVTGCPRRLGPKTKRGRLLGEIITFEFNGKNGIKHRSIQHGEQNGAYFGASLAAGDINNDGRDDLIVGAPYYSTSTYNEGAVYIFLDLETKDRFQKLRGESMNGQFGSAVMFLGDINKDGYGDIAIGAPYEEHGVVYIHLGNGKGVDDHYSQRVVGKDVYENIRGFGIHISRPADIDDNSATDVVIGAHLSADAVLLRGKPIAVMHYKMDHSPKTLNWDSTNFTLNICFSYTFFESEFIDVTRTLAVDKRFRRTNMSRKDIIETITVLKNGTCENVTVLVNLTSNHDDPITVYLTYTLANVSKSKEVVFITGEGVNGTDDFCVRCPLLDKRSDPPRTISIPISVDCGDDKLCIADISIDVRMPGLQENTFLVGSEDYINLIATVKNEGEKAYYTKLLIVLPNDFISLRETPPNCNNNMSVVNCDVANPLKSGFEKTVQVNLNAKNLDKYYGDELTIYFKVITSSNNKNNDTVAVQLKLDRQADVSIEGSSDQENILLGNSTYRDSSFAHMFQVQKSGPSTLQTVLVKIQFPHALHTEDGEVSFIKLYCPEGTLGNRPVRCHTDIYCIPKPIVETDRKILDDESQNERLKRQVEDYTTNSSRIEVKNNSTSYNISSVNTQFINCSMDDVVCSSILCYLEDFENVDIATITVKMALVAEVIPDLFKKKNVLYSTHASVVIQAPLGVKQYGNGPYSVDVSTVFTSFQKVEKIALWIIIVSAIAGLLLLILIVLILIKVGFFKRTKKEELENLRAAAEVEHNDMEYVDDVFETEELNCSQEGLVNVDEDNIKI